MQKYLPLLMLSISIFPSSLCAQFAINLTGKTLVGKDVTYAYSAGEVTGFALNARCIYTPGVIQPQKISPGAPKQKLFDNYHLALLYPNPTTGIIIIETNEPGISEYSVATPDGKMVQTGKFNYLSIDISRQQRGLYLITLFSTDHKKQQTYKIVKL